MKANIIQSPFVTLQHVNNEVNKPNDITPHEAQQTFKKMLKEAIQDVNDIQLQAAEKTEKLAAGKTDDLHDVMIAGEKARITLQATVEVRNKVIEAYQEIMRMQV